MIKILNVIDSLYAGGAESLLKNFLIEAKKYSEFNIDICTLYSRNVFAKDLIDNNIKEFDLGLSFKYNFWGVFKLIKIIKSNDYDIVHVHLFPADLFGAISSLFLPKKIKFIFSEHNVYNRRRSIKIFKLIDRFTYSRYTKVVCVSEKVKESLIDWIPETAYKAVFIRNAVPVGKIRDKKESIYDVLFIGRLEKAKGVDVLFEAIKLLETKYDRKLKVAIVGDGSLNEELKGIAERLNISESVEFLGVRKDINDLMRKSKIFVLPSRWEGLPMVILEVMALGMPAVATKVGGIPEVIEDGKDGILVEPENPEELSNAIIRLLDNKELRSLISSNAYEKIKEEYSIEKYTKTLLSLYKELVK
jgi:glycosyltransferase involved in cell wall biosynthesis